MFFSLCQKLEGSNAHVHKVHARGREVSQEHEEVSVIKVADTVVNPGTMLYDVTTLEERASDYG